MTDNENINVGWFTPKKDDYQNASILSNQLRKKMVNGEVTYEELEKEVEQLEIRKEEAKQQLLEIKDVMGVVIEVVENQSMDEKEILEVVDGMHRHVYKTLTDLEQIKYELNSHYIAMGDIENYFKVA